MLSYNHGFGVWLSGIIALKRPKIISSPNTSEAACQLSRPLGKGLVKKYGGGGGPEHFEMWLIKNT